MESRFYIPCLGLKYLKSVLTLCSHCVPTKMPNTTEMQAWMCCRNDVRVACENRWLDHSPVPYETPERGYVPVLPLKHSRSVSHIGTSILVFGCVSAKAKVSKTSVDHGQKVSWSKKKGADQVWFNGHVFVTFDVSVWSTSNLQSVPGASFMTVRRGERRREPLLELLHVTWSTEALKHWSTEPWENTCDTHGFGEELPPWIIENTPGQSTPPSLDGRGKCSRVPAPGFRCRDGLEAVEFRWFSGSSLEQQMNTVAVSRCWLSVVHGIEKIETSILFHRKIDDINGYFWDISAAMLAGPGSPNQPVEVWAASVESLPLPSKLSDVSAPAWCSSGTSADDTRMLFGCLGIHPK